MEDRSDKHEPEWDGFEYGNVCFTVPMSADAFIVTNNNFGGLPIAKWTNLRTGLYDKVVTGLHDGINLRMMRYSDVLLRAAECENEVNGPTQQAIDWINEVRARAGLAGLNLANFNSKDKLFEQITRWMPSSSSSAQALLIHTQARRAAS